jgi:type 1 glutamine amidotransferase/nicotinamidase-related amidase
MIISCALWATFLLSLGAAYASEAAPSAEDSAKLALTTRRRVETEEGGGFKIVAEAVNWAPPETAIVIVDMWDDHHCVSASRRVAELAPFMNEVVNDVRKKGVLVIHAPSECMDFYKDTPQRRRAQDAPFVKAPVEFKWNRHDPGREGPLPDEVADEGCSCDTPDPCGPSRKAWTRQIDTIDIASGDAVSDDGQEIYNLLEHRGIKNVIVMGVHTNCCVIGRPFGIRQLVYLGKNVLLGRDLTDPFHRAPGRHFRGIDQIVEHIEKYWCPTIASTSLTGRPAFRFKADDRPRVTFVIAEDEYDAATILPELARELERKHGFSYDIMHGDGYNITGLDSLVNADLIVVYVRRRPLPPEQIEHLRAYVKSGKPIVGLRTASHAFHLNQKEPPDGLADWPEFDRDVLGGNYHMHHGNKGDEDPFTYVWIQPGMESHAILTGIPPGEFRVPSWLYKTSPLADTATNLMMGRVGDRKPHEPVAWTNTHIGGGRVFYTSLGHADDFKMAAFRRLLLNGIFWALDRPVPSE